MEDVDEHTQTVEPRSGDRFSINGVSWAGGSPHVRVRRQREPSEFVPLAGLTLSYSSDSAVARCIGHKPFRDGSASWVDCDQVPLGGGHKCDRCTANDATFASQLHHAHTRGSGELDASIQTHLAQQNHLYLAAFRDGSIKVGTSTSTRLETRLAEQGAWRAAIVATAANGVAVREIEALVTEELGIAQSVTARRKLNGLVQPIPDDALLTELSRWTKTVHTLIERVDSDDLDQVTAAWISPVVDDPWWSKVLAYPLDLRSGNHVIEMLGASGRLAAFRRPGIDDIFVADLRHLFGFEVEMRSVVADELTVQDSLF